AIADVAPVSEDKPETAPATVAAASHAAETAATPADTAIADVVPVSEDKPETAPVTVAAASPAAEVPVVAAEPVAQTTAGAVTESKVNADAAPAPVVAEILTAPRTANSFSRLFHEPAKLNLPPSEDGIHNAASKGTRMLQTPLEAFAALPKSRKGNRVDWVKALDNKQIKPRADRLDSNAEMKIRDVQNVIPVKSSMPDVVFSHKIHTQLLACSNCHPEIYAEESGGNQINMSAFSRGEGCGICHNKVAFPLSECRKCHSRKKSALAKANVKP
ncbi:MAG: hypothetical protein OEV26_00555, partial [Gallionella sp.]|nr:hypothetical protein [Gallionella sp.]